MRLAVHVSAILCPPPGAQYAVWNLGTYAAAEADRKADEERAARVKRELAGGVELPALYATPVVPWNESIPDYTGENPPVDAVGGHRTVCFQERGVSPLHPPSLPPSLLAHPLPVTPPHPTIAPPPGTPQLYKKGPFALAVNFYKTVPARRRTADVMDEQLLEDIDALERQRTPSPKKQSKPKPNTLTGGSPAPAGSPTTRAAAPSSPSPAAAKHDDSEYSNESDESDLDTAEYVRLNASLTPTVGVQGERHPSPARCCLCCPLVQVRD
jgi:hypothetical protein